MNKNEYELKVGLEIHQQLASSTKLFCKCNGFDKLEDEIYFKRVLRPTQSELGKTDPAALFESKKSKQMNYIANTNTSCLVEADEEPPHEISKEDDLFLSLLFLKETKEISAYLQEATEAISELSGCAAFIASPRFDQDFIIKMKLVEVDIKRILCVVLTDFGQIYTELIYLPKKMSTFSLVRH